MSTFKKKQISESSTEQASFIELAQRLVEFHKKYGIPLIPFRDPSLPHFSKLPLDHKKMVIAGLQEAVSLFVEMEMNGDKLADSPKLLWRSLNRLGLRPTSDIFDKIGEDDVVEIYSPEHIQIFRNLNIFKYISLTLEEMASIQWWELVNMEKHAADFYVTLGPKMLNNEIKETFPNTLAPYKVKELMGDRYLVEIFPKWMSPIFKGDQCVGLISVITCNLLSEG